MSLSDYLPSPKSGWEMLTAPFRGREGQPWLQATARNMGHAAFGDKIGNYVDQRFLGDAAPGQLGPVQGMAAQIQPNVQPQMQTQSANGQQIMQLMAQLMKQKGGM